MISQTKPVCLPPTLKLTLTLTRTATQTGGNFPRGPIARIPIQFKSLSFNFAMTKIYVAIRLAEDGTRMGGIQFQLSPGYSHQLKARELCALLEITSRKQISNNYASCFSRIDFAVIPSYIEFLWYNLFSGSVQIMFQNGIHILSSQFGVRNTVVQLLSLHCVSEK